MSDRMTACRPLAGGGGFASWGRLTRAEAIAEWRTHYEHQFAIAQKLLALTDDELIVETYLGPWAMKNRTEVTE